MLSVEGVTAGYGRGSILRDVSIDVPEGSIATLLGPNGAGKTSLLRVIAGGLKPRTGRIVFEDKEITGTPPERTVRLGIAHVPEGRGVFPGMTVRENLLMGLHARRGGRRSFDDAIGSVAELFPVLAERPNQLAGTLSGGEQQMLAIARGLLTKPKLLMIDELSLGLAPIVVQRLLAALKEIQQSGVTILLVEQFARLVLGMADVAFVLEHGSLVFAGTSQQLIDNPSVLHGAYLAGRKALQEVSTP
ncbi:MAG TPA: ABC transporter ATP-binding protein [Acidimicrobiia bacterium]